MQSLFTSARGCSSPPSQPPPPSPSLGRATTQKKNMGGNGGGLTPVGKERGKVEEEEEEEEEETKASCFAPLLPLSLLSRHPQLGTAEHVRSERKTRGRPRRHRRRLRRCFPWCREKEGGMKSRTSLGSKFFSSFFFSPRLLLALTSQSSTLFPLFRFFFVKVRPEMVSLPASLAPHGSPRLPARAAASGEGEPPGASLGTPAKNLLPIEAERSSRRRRRRRSQKRLVQPAARPRPCCCYTLSAAVSFARVP